MIHRPSGSRPYLNGPDMVKNRAGRCVGDRLDAGVGGGAEARSEGSRCGRRSCGTRMRKTVEESGCGGQVRRAGAEGGCGAYSRITVANAVDSRRSSTFACTIRSVTSRGLGPCSAYARLLLGLWYRL
jgi:hypothetical protein